MLKNPIKKVRLHIYVTDYKNKYAGEINNVILNFQIFEVKNYVYTINLLIE